MPLSAMMPRIATKPIGVPVGNNAMTTPIRPNGATLIWDVFVQVINTIIKPWLIGFGIEMP
jgi:hypothetical protein